MLIHVGMNHHIRIIHGEVRRSGADYPYLVIINRGINPRGWDLSLRARCAWSESDSITDHLPCRIIDKATVEPRSSVSPCSGFSVVQCGENDNKIVFPIRACLPQLKWGWGHFRNFCFWFWQFCHECALKAPLMITDWRGISASVQWIYKRFSKFAYVDVCVGKCLLTWCERVIQKKTLSPFYVNTIRLDALLQ